MDASDLLEWDQGSLGSMGVEVSYAELRESDSDDELGSRKVWYLLASFKRFGEITRAPSLGVVVEYLGEQGVILRRDVESARIGAGSSIGVSSVHIYLDGFDPGVNESVKSFRVSVIPSAPHPDDPPVDVPISIAAETLEDVGLRSITARGRCGATEFSGRIKVTVEVRAEGKSDSPTGLRFLGVGADGLPHAECDFTLVLDRDPSASDGFIGSAVVEIRTVPFRLIGTPIPSAPLKVLPDISDEIFDVDLDHARNGLDD